MAASVRVAVRIRPFNSRSVREREELEGRQGGEADARGALYSSQSAAAAAVGACVCSCSEKEMNAVVCLDMIGKQTIITNPEDKKDKVRTGTDTEAEEQSLPATRMHSHSSAVSVLVCSPSTSTSATGLTTASAKAIRVC